MRAEPSLSDVLDRFMRERGYSFRRLGDESGVSPQTINNWRRGHVLRPQTVKPLLLVAAALKLSKSEATELLRAAGHATIDDLLSKATAPNQLEIVAPWLITTPHNLPTEVTSFVGRQTQLAALARLLQKACLVTLTGPGGSGKTRLALRLAASLLASFRDGVFLVPLAPLTDPDLVVPAIAQRLGVAVSSQRPLIERLQEYLRPKQMLLILDNFEKLVAAGPDVAQLLTYAPELKLLVTSQVHLGVYAEHIFEVPPLDLPDVARPVLVEAAQNEAVHLFAERAQAVAPRFTLSAANIAAVVALCHRLDGLPLSLELAAARVPSIPPDRMVEQMSARLDLLVRGAVDLPLRQQSLRGTLDWSYDLLDPVEQILLRRLAIFVGGCSPEAAEFVCGDADGGTSATPVVPVGDQRVRPFKGRHTSEVWRGLTSLVHKSLVQKLPGVHGTHRFVLLETIREYASELLEASGEVSTMQERHALYFTALAEAAAPGLRNAEQAHWLERLEQEHDNLRAVLTWVTDLGRGTTALQITAAVWPFWHVHGHWTEGRQHLDAALALADGQSKSLLVQTLTGAATLAHAQYDRVRAEALFIQSQALAAELGDPHAVAEATYNLGWIAQSRREHGRAIDLYQESIAHFRDLGDRPGVLTALVNLTWTTMLDGQLEQARSYGDGGLELARELDDKASLASILNALGLVALYQQELTRASTYYAEGLEHYRSLHHLGGISATIMNQGYVALFEGRLDHAETLFRESLAIGRDLHDQLVINYTLDGLGGVAGYRGQYVQSARLGGAAEAVREHINTPIPASEQATHDALVAAFRSAAGDEVWTNAWNAGRALPLAEAIAEALRGSP